MPTHYLGTTKEVRALNAYINLTRASETISDGGTLTWAPGYLTGVWAEENTRESIFQALRRKETFATSGVFKCLNLFPPQGWEFGYPIPVLLYEESPK